MWQGKAIFWILFLPVALSLTYRFLRQGNYSDLVWLFLLAIAGVGLSNTALYLVPAVIGCCAISFLGVELSQRQGREDFWKQFRHCLLLAVPLTYPVAILALLRFNVIPKPIDLHEFGPKYVPWSQGLGYVVGGAAEYLRDIVLMITVPLLIVRGKLGCFLFFYLCAVWLFCLNPLLANRWMENILALTYFRLVYLLQFPLLCAMLAAAGPRLGKQTGGSLRDRTLLAGALLAVIISFFHSYRALSIMPRSGRAAWKSPGEYQLLKANTDFARVASRYIAHTKLLAPGWTASCELPLLFPEMKIVAPRFVTHYFTNAGNPTEGALRQQAQVFVEGEKTDSLKRIESLAAQFRVVIESGRANAVAAPESESARVLATLQSIDPRWHRVLEAGGLVLMLPNGAAPQSPR
jgi:hypothetical protein